MSETRFLMLVNGTSVVNLNHITSMEMVPDARGWAIFAWVAGDLNGERYQLKKGLSESAAEAYLQQFLGGRELQAFEDARNLRKLERSL